MNEHDWIARLQAASPGVDFRHDTAYTPQTGQIATCDMLVEGVHFNREWSTWADIGWKSLAVNLSDIAATGGTPTQVLVGLGCPSETALKDLEALYEGLQACAQQYRVTVVGGDTVRAPQLTLCVTALGSLPQKSQPGRRSTARPGHVVAISGPHGLSRAGLYAFEKNLTGYKNAKAAHTRPIPRVRLGQQIASVVPHFAMMDTSDGLADAALRVAQASEVDIVLDPNRLTIPQDVAALAQQAEIDPLDWVLYGGEDFELFVTLPAQTAGMFAELRVIGRVEAAQGRTGQAFLEETLGQRRALTFDRTFQHFEGECSR